MMGRVFLLFEDYYILMRAEKGRRVRRKRALEFLNILNPRSPIFPPCVKSCSHVYEYKRLSFIRR